MSRSHRLFDLMQILRRRRLAVSGNELAREMGVSLRTIRRDVASLQAMGADIEGEPGVGYVLKPGFLLPPLMFSEEELQAIVLGAQWVQQHTDNSFGASAQNALAKIEAVLPSELRGQVYDTAFYAGHRQPEPQSVDLAMVRQAMREQRKVAISYLDDKDSATERIIWPISLGFFSMERYLAAWCELRQDFRVFRADRIESADLLDDRYPGRRRDLVKQWLSQIQDSSDISGG